MYKDELLNINSQEKAYLLGLIYADGSVSSNRGLVSMYLHNKDKDLLYRIVKIFPFFKITKADKKNQTGIFASNNLIKDDFIANGCFPQKSSNNKDLLNVPEIITNYRHFIRGYYDGDGGCSLSFSQEKTQKRVYIYSASKEFLEDIIDIMIDIPTGLSQQPNGIYKIEIKTKGYEDFYHYLYNNATIWMERKKLKLEEILKTNFFIQKEAPVCKFCNSNNTVFNGYYRYKNTYPRIWCKDCNKNFVLKTAPISSNINSGEDELLEPLTCNDDGNQQPSLQSRKVQRLPEL